MLITAKFNHFLYKSKIIQTLLLKTLKNHKSLEFKRKWEPQVHLQTVLFLPTEVLIVKTEQKQALKAIILVKLKLVSILITLEVYQLITL